MKRTRNIFSDLKPTAALLLLGGAVLLGGCGKPAPPPPAPAKKPAAATGTNAPANMATNAVSADTISVFTNVPGKTVDPFYPVSSRGGSSNTNISTGPAPPTEQNLKVSGISSSGRLTLVVINGLNFSAGETRKVQVPPPPDPPAKMVKVQVLQILKDRVQINAEGEAGPRWLPWKH